MAKTHAIVLFAATAAACLSSPVASAEDTGFFVDANVGKLLSTYRRTDLNGQVIADLGGAASGSALTSSSVRKDHVMWSAGVGYMLSRNFGIEASYLHLGSLRYTATGARPSTDGTDPSAVSVHLDLKSRGPAVAALGVLPMSNFWEIDARLGAYEGKTTTTFATSVGSISDSGRLSGTSTSLLAGVGTALSVSTHCTFRVDYMRLEHLSDKAFNRSFNVDLVTAGVVFMF